ncbi:MAG: hypothetical protein ACXVRZ_16090 [Gaiellaceae bacterium]
MTATIHLNPTAPLAERVLLPGDPGRALLLAQLLLDAPKMFNQTGDYGVTRERRPTVSYSPSRAPAWEARARQS